MRHESSDYSLPGSPRLLDFLLTYLRHRDKSLFADATSLHAALSTRAAAAAASFSPRSTGDTLVLCVPLSLVAPRFFAFRD